MKKGKKIGLLILTFAAIVGAGVPVLIYSLIGGPYSWGYVAALSVGYGFLLTLALVLPAKRKGLSLLLAISAVTLPYLWQLFSLLGLALPIAFYGGLFAFSIVSTWLIYGIWKIKGMNAWYRSSATLLVLGAMAIGTNWLISLSLPAYQNIINIHINYVSTIILVLITAVVGFFRSGTKNNSTTSATR